MYSNTFTQSNNLLNKISFSSMKVNELKKYCKDNNIKGYSNLSKKKLLDKVNDFKVISFFRQKKIFILDFFIIYISYL